MLYHVLWGSKKQAQEEMTLKYHTGGNLSEMTIGLHKEVALK